jgi:diaminohydroxyphosphoribosylaminopyrimidine deaminase/5-amino-6-(5-phosphoribosylamino)uracil reductase
VATGVSAPQAPEVEVKARGLKVVRVAETAAGRLDLLAALKLLAEQGLTRVLFEAGPVLATALLGADLVDEAVLFRSRTVIGADGIDALEALPLTALTQSPRLRRVMSQAAGADTLEVFERSDS